MAAPYFERGNTRVALLATLVNITAPSLVELNTGVDITPMLTDNGLEPNWETVTSTRAPWKSDLVIETPIRRQGTWSLRGYRAAAGSADDRLWARARWRATGALVVRRGVPVATPWLVGQSVEVVRFTFGQRSHLGSGTVATTFVVPLYVSAFDDDGRVG